MAVIPHSRPTLSPRCQAAALKPLKSGQISMGAHVARFEGAFARSLGVREAAAVSSGTAALHLALLALDVGPADEVIIPTHVCTALLNAVCYVGARPVLADVHEADGNISPQDVMKKLTRRTRAIIVPHMYGAPADLNALLHLGVPVIEDCAQSVGASYGGRPVGAFGSLSTFSFYATKMMATGEGGMVASSDAKLMARVRDRLTYDHKDNFRLRYNYKMADIPAALGCAQLAELKGFIARRRALAAFYDGKLQGLPCILPKAGSGVDMVYYRYVVRVPGQAQKVIAAMKARGVNAEQPLFRPIHHYLNLKGFPVSDKLMDDCVSLPIYPSLTQAQAARVVRAFRSSLV